MVAIVKRGRLVNIRNGSRKDTDPSDLRVVGDAYTTDIVFNGSNLACTSRPVVVVKEYGFGEVDMVVEVIRIGFILYTV